MKHMYPLTSFFSLLTSINNDLFTGTFVTMYGKMFSDRYGSNLAASTNGRAEKLLRSVNQDVLFRS
mgnify:CR=1 FL=1